MRKKVLVAVVVALFAAPVFAELTIYGTADFGFEYIDLGLDPSGARVRVGRFTSGVLDPSVLGIKGEKDIDPDSKIGFQFETGFTFERGLFLDSGSNIDQLRIIPGATFGTLWNRMARIYLKTKFGEVSLGRQYSPISYVKCNLDPTCGGLGFSPDTYSEGTDRLDNSVKLTTNSIRGLVAQVSYSTGDQNMTNDDITVPEVPVNGSVAYGGSVQYTSGPVYFGAAYSSVNDSYTDYPRPGVPPAFKRPSNLVSYILGFSYSFPKVKPFVSFRRQTRYTYPTGSFYVPVSKNNVLSIGASMSSGRGTFVTNFSI
ncbi:porin [Candidatus Ichthyocystis hellenicum]|uniref:porin n=2 Tax=Candidatus Ichthyocystis TaxID=2929841 RepID=UPI0015853A1B|nr:porin [Candidatus Ichthyocystis hellenicum]